MGLFDFLKPKKDSLNDNLSQMLSTFFPKGETDINTGTDELLQILNNKIERKLARDIFVKSVSMSRISAKFDRERLVNHLRGYCLQHFNDEQIDRFLTYLNTLTMALAIHGSPPSQVKRKGDGYAWY